MLLLDRARAVRVLEMGIAIPVYRPADSRPWLEDSGGGCLLSKMISKLGHFIPKRVPAPLLEMVDLPLGPSECEGHSQAFRVIEQIFALHHALEMSIANPMRAAPLAEH